MSTPPYIPSPHPYGGEGDAKRVLLAKRPGPYGEIVEQVEAKLAEDTARNLILYPARNLVERHLSTASMFCRSLVSMGYLTQQQMEHAAQRYRLGMSRDGGVIFWQIGRTGKLYDGKIMYYRSDCHRDHNHKPTWVMSELKKYYMRFFPELVKDWDGVHNLFGGQLLKEEFIHPNPGLFPYRGGEKVAVVEAEKTAVIMSELYPEYLWVATGGLNELTESKLYALKGRKIILFPDTDEHHQAYDTWYKIRKRAEYLLGQRIYLSPLLEQQATNDQKRRKIDIVDFYFEKQLTRK